MPPAERAHKFRFHWPANRALAFALAAGLLILMAAGVLLVIKNRRGNSSENLPVIAVVTLRPGTLRGGGELPRVTIPPHAGDGAVEFHLVITGKPFNRYHASLTSPEGNAVFSASKLTARGAEPPAYVPVKVPLELIPAGDYQMTLAGVDDSGADADIQAYNFRIPRQAE